MFGDDNAESDEDRAVRLFHEGKFDDSLKLAKLIDERLGVGSDERWPLLVLKCQMATGQYEDANATYQEALQRFDSSIQLRWTGIDVLMFNKNVKRSLVTNKAIGELVSRSSWKYRETPDRIILGKWFLNRGADAKDVLDSFFNPLKDRESKNPEVYRAIGDLALQKQDYQLAADNYAEVVKLSPTDASAMANLAKAWLPSNTEKANEYLKNALEVNPDHVESLLMMAVQNVRGEQYAKAEALLARVLRVNPHEPRAWAYKAVMAHLDNDPAKERECREKGLAFHIGNPEVDHIIGLELSNKYRFEEGQAYQRTAIEFDKDFLPAKIQLAHDLLRLGQELEGWKLADEVFDADQYSVVAHNLVTLRDNLSKFSTLERDGFVVRMEQSEADIYGDQVLDLLVRAKADLCKKYESELQTPIFIEIFPRQQDFAIRTFGLPGGAGFLGVCFGRVITMNSPAAQGANLTNWESVLWHEFCHVVTLQKTKNKMPRWLSEGISVYEERLADRSWGQSMDLANRKMILSEEDLTPVSELSDAFLRVKSPAHLQFAYFESSMVVEYIVEKYGMPALVKVLEDLSIGTPINDALRRHVAPVGFLDKKFAEYARSKANQYAANANWDDVENTQNRSAEDWATWNDKHPNNVRGLILEASSWIKEKRFEQAIVPLKDVLSLNENVATAYRLLAGCYRNLNDEEKELEALEEFVQRDPNRVDSWTRLLALVSAKRDWEKTKTYSRKLLALNPLLSAPHRYLSMAAAKTDDDESLIQSLQVLAQMNPLDRADVHYQLASAFYRTKQLDSARRQVLKALEHAPRYRDAHALLLKIVEQMDSSDPSKALKEENGEEPK